MSFKVVSAWPPYRRLLKYTRPYRTRFAVGIIAAVIFSGSAWGLLHLSQRVIQPFETPAVAPQPTGPVPAAAGTLPGDLAKVTKMAQRFGIPVLQPDGRMTWQFLLLTLISAPVVVIARTLGAYVHRYFMRWVGSRVVADLRNALFERLAQQSLGFFGKSDVGNLISRCTNDTATLENVIATTAVDATRAPIEILVAIAFVLSFSIRNHMLAFMLMAVIGFPLCIVPVVLLGRRVKRYTQRALDRISDVLSRMHETFTGIRVIKAFNTEAEETARFRARNQGYFSATMRALRAELLMTPLMEGVAIILGCLFLIVCFARGIRLSQIVPVAMAGILIYRPVKQMAAINANLQRGAAALDRIFALLDTDTAVRERPGAVALTEFRDRIVLDRVSFGYEPGVPVLYDVSLEIPRGTILAIVGETGSGKTTLVNLVARFYDPTAGRVLIDGIDLRDVQIASLRRLIGIVSQETVLFNDTIANNIAYGSKDATFEQIVAATKLANAHEFIMADPGGYQRMVGEKGFVLSGGERQRIAIARAILRNPPILILDEATSALDTVTERLVQEAIARLMENRTVLAIAHRLSTVRHAHLIVVMERGRIVERGTHDELYRAGGQYRRLCEMQFLDFKKGGQP